MEPLFAMLTIAVFVAVVFAYLQGRFAYRNYGILGVTLAEMALGLTTFWGISAWAEEIASNPNNPGPVGFGALLMGGFATLSVGTAIILNLVSGTLIWWLTRAE